MTIFGRKYVPIQKIYRGTIKKFRNKKVWLLYKSIDKSWGLISTRKDGKCKMKVRLIDLEPIKKKL